MLASSTYDVVIIGAGVSGSTQALNYVEAGLKVLVLEAGSFFTRSTYPTKEIDSNSRLYWGGGIELNTSATIGLLRPKVVGGGSIVNQALMDRFDENAFESWRNNSGVTFFKNEHMASWYAKAEDQLLINEVPQEWQNGNAKIFYEGFKLNGFQCAPLKRAQKNCRFDEGNDCIECLSGCRIDSKQSTPVTTLRKALKRGCHLISDFEVKHLKHNKEICIVGGIWSDGKEYKFSTKKIILAAGSIGNSKLLLMNDFAKKYPALGKHFYTHPQFMVLGLYDKLINAHKGPLQSFKSNDPHFRLKGFKLENVFAPPVAISMLVPGFGKNHSNKMKKITQLGCIEVAIRDTTPGKIQIRGEKVYISKELNEEDKKRKKAGLDAIYSIFEKTGAQEIIPGELGIGLHLMGGLRIGLDSKNSVTTPEFHLHEHSNIFVADSSIFPDAPGINPSLTIMALSQKASSEVIKALR